MTIDLEKLKKFCGMLTSSYDAERAMAALKASAILKAAGLTWETIITRAFANEPTREEQEQAWGGFRGRTYSRRQAPERLKNYNGVNVAQLLRAMMNWPKGFKAITSWERSFLENISIPDNHRVGLTERQCETLFSIAEKMGVLQQRA